MDKIILLDLDGTVADWDAAMIRDLQRCLPIDYYPKIEIWMKEERRNRPEWVENLMSVIRNQVGWWFNLEPLDLGMHLFELIKSSRWDWEINVLTKGPATKPNAWMEKVQWCTKYLGTVPVTVCANKSLVYGRVLVDDYPPYMEQWLKYRPNGLGIMPAHFHNRGFKHPNVIRVNSEKDLPLVKRALDIAWVREDGEVLDLDSIW